MACRTWGVLVPSLLLSLVLVGAAGGAEVAAPPPPRPGLHLVDSFTYEPPRTVAQAWAAQDAAVAPAETVTLGGRAVLKLPCNFAGTTMPRGIWDGLLSLDLSLASAISFDVYAENLRAIGHAQVYLHSGEGWYGCSWYPAAEGKWCHVRLLKSHFFVDAPGAGWATIDRVRFSPWALRRENAALYVANLAVEQAQSPALIVRLTVDGPDKAAEQKNASKFVQTVADLLEGAGLSLPVVDSPDLTADLLKQASIVVLPYGSGLSPETVKLLADYLDGGGKLLACFSLPGALAERLGVGSQNWRGAKTPGEFSSIHFVGEGLPGVPRQVGQRSWGISQVTVVPGRGTVAAWWHSEDGIQTDAPALVLSGSGAYFSHVVINDDAAGKRALLKGLLARYCPTALRQAAEVRLGSAGTGLGAGDWAEAVKLVAAEPAYGERAAAAAAKAQEHYEGARAKFAAGDFAAACTAAEAADAALTEAYCLAQRGAAGEFRATWCHPVTGLAGQTWDQTAAWLKRNGIDHLILNALHGASAGYPSQVVPTDASLPPGSTAFADCVAACRKHGIQLHVWITNYQPHGHAPKQFIERLKAEGRLQVDNRGNPADQLCPSDDRNVALQRDMMVEAARLDGVAGIHFDYIRYPSGDTCYCATCRRKFEALVGQALPEWPQEVLSRGPLRDRWLQFRCDNITRLVREVRAEVKKVAPRCLVSAAVFSNYPQCRDDVGQDWKLWVQEGLLDFVCPMDYTGSDAEFASKVRSQLEVVGGRIPCYPGIGLLDHQSPADAVRQIRLTRELKTGGFVIWSIYPQYADTYPLLGAGVLQRR